MIIIFLNHEISARGIIDNEPFLVALGACQTELRFKFLVFIEALGMAITQSGKQVIVYMKIRKQASE